MTPYRPATADETLRELEARAWEIEAQHRYDSVDRRSVRHEVDTRRMSDEMAHGRIVLVVVAAYPKWFEAQAFYGHAQIGHRYDVKAHLAYVCEYEGAQLHLRGRRQALEVLETRGLPSGVQAPASRVVEPWTEEQYDDLFAEVAARSKTPKPYGPAEVAL